jgi:hypothetical protein
VALLETFSPLVFLIGLIVVGIGVWLIRMKGYASTAGGLVVGNIGLYVLLSGFQSMTELDRLAIVVTTLFVSFIIMIFLPITTVRIVGLVFAILSFIGLQSIMVSLPDSSNIKFALTKIGQAASTLWSVVWPWD